MNITELKIKDGRIFRIVIENKSQAKRLNLFISKYKDKIQSIDTNKLNGVHSIKQFEKFEDTFK